MYADLHIHSNFSDGTDTPMEIFKLAEQNNIKVISITDHDSFGGSRDARKFKQDFDVRLIDGIELSIMTDKKFMHILGYHIDINNIELTRYIEEANIDKTENTKINFDNAVGMGVFTYDWNKVLEYSAKQPRISGIHVVKAMQKDGYMIDGVGHWAMFREFFLISGRHFIDTEKKTAYEAVDVIKTAGGIPIIAHPRLINDDKTVLELIDYGAQGIEVYHPIHSDSDVKKYMQIAKEKNIMISGGTDWHGGNNGKHITHFGMRGLEHGDYDILKTVNMF